MFYASIVSLRQFIFTNQASVLLYTKYMKISIPKTYVNLFLFIQTFTNALTSQHPTYFKRIGGKWL